MMNFQRRNYVGITFRSYFEDHWREYLALRKISEGDSAAVFPEKYGAEERDKYYTSIAFGSWGGASGHDSTIIA